jgi:hypothetical protein
LGVNGFLKMGDKLFVDEIVEGKVTNQGRDYLKRLRGIRGVTKSYPISV